MAWHRLSSPLLALLPAFALLGACDADDGGDMEGLSDIETEDQEDGDEGADEDEGEDGDEDEDEDEGEDADEDVRDGQYFQPCEGALDDDPGIACEMDDGQEGLQHCISVGFGEDAQEVLTPCSLEEPACTFDDNWDDGCASQTCLWDGEAFYLDSWEAEGECATPLVLNFDGGPIEYGPVAAATFDLSSDSSCTNTAWPTSPWLALDRDGDGMIRSGAELFGSATAMSSGGHAANGFGALAELDSNLDGKITAADERFSELVLWNDWDQDRLGAYAELQPLSQTSLVSIDLGYTKRAECDGAGNCGIERASFEYRKGDTMAFGEVVDVHLLCQ